MPQSGLRTGSFNKGIKAQSAARRRDKVIRAAIEVIAEQGVRGLTHRNVDRHLDWPLGSTSNYFRRRSELLMAMTERIMQLDLMDLAILEDDFQSSGVTVELLTERLINLMEKWMQPAGRVRAIARAEILFESTRSPEIQQATQAQMGVAEALFMRIFDELGSADSLASAEFFGILMTGMSVGMRVMNKALGRHELQVLVQAWISLGLQRRSGKAVRPRSKAVSAAPGAT